MNVGYLVSRAARQYANNVCVVEGDKRLTFREVDERCNRLANALLGLGLNKGDRIAILTGNNWRCLEVDYAIAKAGLIRVPLNPRMSAKDHVMMVNETEVRAFFIGPDYVEHVSEMAPELATVQHFIVTEGVPPGWIDYEGLLANSSVIEPLVDVNEDDGYTFSYTSGTTGRPRAVLHHHGSWIASAIYHLAEFDNIRESDAIMHAGPMTHISSPYLLPFFVRGGRQVVLKKLDPLIALETIQKEKIGYTQINGKGHNGTTKTNSQYGNRFKKEGTNK